MSEIVYSLCEQDIENILKDNFGKSLSEMDADTRKRFIDRVSMGLSESIPWAEYMFGVIDTELSDEVYQKV